MSLDQLLLWASVKGSGSWSQFRAAVEELHGSSEGREPVAPEASERSERDLPVYHEARLSLQRLGHVEFGGGAQSWRVVPPCVAFLPGATARGLLCGARSRKLLESLDGVAEVDALALEGMPRRVLLGGLPEDTLASRVRALGLHVQLAAPLVMLSATPGVRSRAAWMASPMPETPGWSVHQFSAEGHQWEAVPQDFVGHAKTALFRFVLKHQRFYYLVWHGHSYRVPVQVGKYVVMGNSDGGLLYDPSRQILSVPAICRPPLLVERALVLCSGVLPEFDPMSSRVAYSEVPLDVARLAAQLLCQEMR